MVRGSQHKADWQKEKELERWMDDVTEFCDYVLRWMQAREQGVPYYNGL